MQLGVGGAERGFGDAFPELGFSEDTSGAYLFGLRTLRSYYFCIEPYPYVYPCPHPYPYP